MDDPRGEALRRHIQDLVAQYYRHAHAPRPFVPGTTMVPVSGRVYDAQELMNVVEAGLDFWLTTGRFAKAFERALSEMTGSPHVVLTNSGSSANLLAVSALTSPALGDRRLRVGDEVITVAASFPTTINPILQQGLVPVFLDVELPTYNVQVDQLERAWSPRTRAIMLAHTMGNPFPVEAVTAFARAHHLWLVEDTCDALGATYGGQWVGTFGDIGTLSFYPAHHITTGEGGALLTGSGVLKKVIESFRDWGRDCWCDTGKENTCGKRFGWQMGELPAGYDHKYIYSHIGYNLKMTDMQPAVGLAQLPKLPEFIRRRRENFQRLYTGLARYEEFLLLPQSVAGATPNWFGFVITVNATAPFARNALVEFLERHRVATRMLFTGNILRQPAYQDIRARVVGDLPNAEAIMHRTFWIGVYPGLTDEMLDYVLQVFEDFFRHV